MGDGNGKVVAIQERFIELVRSVRNLGREGVAAMAISAVDMALWDWKARYLKLPVYRLLGAARESIRVYGSGGFTSYSEDELVQQFADWARHGFTAMKMKVGRAPEHDVGRVGAGMMYTRPARCTIG